MSPRAAAGFGPAGERWRALALALLIGAAAANGCTVELAGRTVYPEYLALAAVLPLLAVAVLRGRLAWRWPLATWPLVGWLAVALAASLGNAPRPAGSTVLWCKLAMMVATFAVTANLARGRVERAAALQCAAAASVAVLGLAAAAAWRLAGTTVGTQRSPGGNRLPLGPLLETNLLGSYLLVGVLLALGLLSARRHLATSTRWAAGAALALGLPGLVATVTRAAWLGLAVALDAAGLAWLSRRRRAVRLAGVAVQLGLVLAAGTFVADRLGRGWRFSQDGPTSATVTGRLSSLPAFERDGNLWVRVEVMRNALGAWREHPWIGRGMGAFGDLFQYPMEQRPGWIPNFFVHHLFDSGVLGLLALVAGIGGVLLGGVRAWRRAAGARRGVLAGLLLGGIGLAVAFQTTEGSWLAFPWIVLGLLEAAAGPGDGVPAA